MTNKMERSPIDELSQLENEAKLRLRTGASRRGFIREIQALVLPSFEDHRAYELMLSTPRATTPLQERPTGTSADNSSVLAVRTIWRKSIDVEKFRDPVERLRHGVSVRLQPTIEEADANVAREQLAALLFRATTLAVPPHIPDSGVGLDGTTYELVFGRLFVQARFQWWCDAPAGWEPLAALLQEIERLVENAIGSTKYF